MGKIVGYIRVSTDKQTVENQEHAILKYCSREKLHVGDWYKLEMSSRRTTKQRRIEELLETLKSGDTLIVSELSRLARSVGQIAIIVDALRENGVRFISLKEGIQINGKKDIQTKVMITMFSLFAEIERDLISERTKEGLERARAQGKLLGRPKGRLGFSKLDGKESQIKELMDKGVTRANIARIVGVSWPTLQNFLKTRQLP
ncbi:MAG: resolvase [Desulfatitalea sp. BRH_c12]|nr:MAG: resolvase [Desulfatitalea sp. BRH_c12]